MVWNRGWGRSPRFQSRILSYPKMRHRNGAGALLGARKAQRSPGPSGPGAETLLLEFRRDLEGFFALVILAGQPLGLVLQGEVERYVNDFLGRGKPGGHHNLP